MGEAEIISYEYLFYEVLYLGFFAEVYCIWIFLLKCVVYSILDMMYCMRVFLGCKLYEHSCKEVSCSLLRTSALIVLCIFITTGLLEPAMIGANLI